MSPLTPTIALGRQPYVPSPDAWWIGNSMHDKDEDGMAYRRNDDGAG